MIDEFLLQFLVNQIKELTNKTKTINNKFDNLIAQVDSIGEKMSKNKLDCLEDQFEYTDPSAFNISRAVPSQMVVELSDNHCSTNCLAQPTLDSAVTMSPTDLVLVCSASAPSVPSVANDSASSYDHCFLGDTLTLLSEFAQHVTTQSLENNTGYKVWKPGLCSA